MAFSDKEISNDAGIKIGLYHFRRGTQNWYYTSADRVVSYGGNDYLPIAISDGGVTMGGEVGYDFEVTLPSTNPIAIMYRVTPPSGRVYLKVRRMQLGEADAPLDWSGTLGNIKPKSLAGATIVCRSSISGLKRTGLRLTWQRQCPHALYDRQCKVDPATWAVPYVISGIVGNVVTLVTAGVGLDKPAGYFTGGMVRWQVATDTYEYRMIEAHTAPRVFTLFGRGDGLAAAMNVTLYPGCSRDISTSGCLRFNNVDNYGGHLYMPGKSPFDGTPVF